MTDVNKDITVESSGTKRVLGLKQAVLASSPLLSTIFDKVDWKAGTLLCPYNHVPKDGETNHVISGMELTKDNDVVEKLIVKETLEDAAPETKMLAALESIMANEAAQKIEKGMLNEMLNDVAIPAVTSAGADWTGIELCIADLGSHVFNTVGSFVAVVSLTDYLAIIRDTAYKRARDVLGIRIQVIVSTSLIKGQMVLMHEHGVAGSTMIKDMEIHAAPASDAASLLLPYRTGLAYDVDYVRVVKP